MSPSVTAGRVVWSAPSKVLDLVENEIHVWHAPLECVWDLIPLFESTLSDDEKSRAARFHFTHDRESFIAARGILRGLAGAYLKRAPREVNFQYSPEGKPYISEENIDWPIRFNLSHALGTALYAFARGREVGIDLERVRSDFPREAIAERFFAPEEAAELRAVPSELQAEGFFNCWTRKEAYVKARGKGLQIPLDSFEVALSPGAPARFVRGVESWWNLVAFTPEPNYVAALAFNGSPCKVRFLGFERRVGL
jgi:4'-phosphopantetheinyl transferase